MSAWYRLATVTASTKRAAMVNSKVGVPSAYLSGLRCTPFYAVDTGRAGALVQRYRINGGVTLLETFVVGRNDIDNGDILVVGGVEYVVREVATWDSDSLSEPYQRITVENLRGA